MRLRALTLGLGVLLWGSPAWSDTVGNWLAGCQSGRVTNVAAPGSWVCWNPPSGGGATNDSPPLSTRDCENIDLFRFVDIDGDGTACDLTFDVQACPLSADLVVTATGAYNDSRLDNACVDLSDGSGGIVELNATSPQQGGIVGGLVRIEGDGGSTSPTSCQVEVHCAQGP